MVEPWTMFGFKGAGIQRRGTFCLFVFTNRYAAANCSLSSGGRRRCRACFMTVEIEIGLVRTANRSTKKKSLRLDIGRWTTDAFTMIEHTETSYDQNSKLFRESTIARFTRFLAVPGGSGDLVSRQDSGQHSFRGSYGGYAFPLCDNRAGHGPFNVSPNLLAGLAANYGAPVSAQDTFDAILALLSATSYTLRFAEDLEDVFPHVPFPSDHALFSKRRPWAVKSAQSKPSRVRPTPRF